MDHVDGLMQIARSRELQGEIEPSLGAFSHQFRNRLNSIKLAIYLARRQATDELVQPWEALDRDYQAIEDRVDRIQQVCRVADPARVAIDLNLLFADRSSAWARVMQQGGAHLNLIPPPGPCPTQVDINRIGLGLDELVCWRAMARAGHREVHVGWDRAGDATTIQWRETFGTSTPAENGSTELGQTWALPTLARSMTDHHGTFRMSEAADWGWTMHWPC